MEPEDYEPKGVQYDIVNIKHYRVDKDALLQKGQWLIFYAGKAREAKLLTVGKPDEDVLGRYSRKDPRYKTFIPSQKGGKTEVTIVDSVGNEFTGEAYCSMLDSFCYKTGRELALSVAIEKLESAY